MLPRCANSSTEREFPSDRIYRGDDRGIVGVESLSPQGFGVFVVHTILDVCDRGCGSPGAPSQLLRMLPSWSTHSDSRRSPAPAWPAAAAMIQMIPTRPQVKIVNNANTI